MASANQDAHKELFLDILTKEEKEALLTKKMEDIRKRNEALQKRHAEIEADKKRAEKTGSALPPQPSIREAHIASKPSSMMEDHDPRKHRHSQHQHQMQQQQQQQQLSASKPATRNKPPAHGGGGGGGGGKSPRERPKSQDFRSDASYEYEPIVDIADLDSRLAKRSHSPTKHRRNPPKERPPAALSNNDRPFNSGPAGANHTKNQPAPDRRGPREPRGGPRVYSQTFTSRGQGRISSEDGPPPDPVNFLSDRARDPGSSNHRQSERQPQESGGNSGGGGGRGKDTRRHPRNFGGQDFNNVKTQMKAVKEKERDRRSFPPKNKMEMTLMLTGMERFQYEEWKAERQKVDQERMERQKTSSGEWRRAWDQEKNSKDFEEPPSPSRTEPARRPAGRIGSGRFDRGDRDDRRADNLSQSPKGTSGMQGVAHTPETERKPPAGRGRGRGRGRARAQAPGGEKPPRPRTWSGGDDSRTVECTNDNGLLLVKIDKSRNSDDHSVEVEYGDEEATPPVERRKSSPSKKRGNRRSPVKQRSQNQTPPQVHQFQDAEVVPMSPPMPMSVSSHDGSTDGRPASLSQSLSHCSTDEWEDITGTDSDLYGTTEDEAEGGRKGTNVRLNPDAPVFQPTSPALLKTPASYHSSDSSASGPVSPRSPPVQPLAPAGNKPTAPAGNRPSVITTDKPKEPVTNGSLHPDQTEKPAEEKEDAAGESLAEVEREILEENSGGNEGQTSEIEGDHAQFEDAPQGSYEEEHYSEGEEDHFVDTEDVEDNNQEEVDHDRPSVKDVPAGALAPAGTSLADELSAITGCQPPRPVSPHAEEDLGDEIEEDDDGCEEQPTVVDTVNQVGEDDCEKQPSPTDPVLADGSQEEQKTESLSAKTDSEGIREALPDPATVEAPEECADSCEKTAPDADTPPQDDNQQMATVSSSSPEQTQESETVKVMDKAETASEDTAAASSEDCATTAP